MKLCQITNYTLLYIFTVSYSVLFNFECNLENCSLGYTMQACMHIMPRSTHNTCVSAIYVHSPFWRGSYSLVKHWDCYMKLMEGVSTAMFLNFTSSPVVAEIGNKPYTVTSLSHDTHTVHLLMCTAWTDTESIYTMVCN